MLYLVIGLRVGLGYEMESEVTIYRRVKWNMRGWVRSFGLYW